jgi:hypothetical protein
MLGTSEKLENLNTDILKHIVGFTVIDVILRQSTTFRRYERFLERNIVLRRDVGDGRIIQ